MALDVPEVTCDDPVMGARRGIAAGAIPVGIYTRISKADEVEGLGVARQESDCRMHCAARGWEVASVYEDNDLSAYKRRTVRPEFQKMLEDIKAGQIDGVVVWDIDRPQRSSPGGQSAMKQEVSRREP